MAGFVEIKIKGRVGDTVSMSHAEALDREGQFYTGNLRDAKATDMYILKAGHQVLEPHFTYLGFRYIKVSGIKKLDLANIRAVALHSALKKTGTFSCSDPISWAKASYICPFGKIISNWRVNGRRFYLHVVIPHSTSARVEMPDKKITEVASGHYDFSCLVNEK